MARKKKLEEPTTPEEETPKLVYEKVDPIDRIPDVDYDEAEIIKEIEDEKNEIDIGRSEWYDRKIEFLQQWDNYLDYPSTSLLDGVKMVHLPMTFEKIQAWHARVYKSIFSVDPIFTCIPTNNVTVEESESTKKVMWWYLTHEINYEAGVKPFVDELLWDLGTDGWAVAYKSWMKLQRKMIDTEKIIYDEVKEQALEAFGELKNTGKIRKEYKEVEKLVTRYNGVLLETVPHECCYFPDYIPTSGDMNHPRIVMLEREYSEDDLICMKNRGYFNAEAVDELIEFGPQKLDARKEELKRLRKENVGIGPKLWNSQEGYPVFTVFMRKDLIGDGYPQEYVWHVSLRTKKVLRVTYLDRVCRDGNRPVYKFDLIKRPRSAYSRGFSELLYPYNLEVDEYHNLRRICGFLTNIPWGFYRPGGGLEKEKLKIKAGTFYPTDDPRNDVHEMAFTNKTAWAMQEEGLTQAYADKLTSMPPMMQGQVPQQVGPLRSTSGVNSLMAEAMVPFDVYLDRFRVPFSRMLQGIHSDLQNRLPESIKTLVLGENSQWAIEDIPRARIQSKYKFLLAANDSQYNPERDRQNAMVLSQMLMSQLPVQLGVVTAENMYNALKNVLEKNNFREIEKYLTAPQMADRPLSLYQEYATCAMGRVPHVALNDTHEEKAKSLIALSQLPQHEEGKRKGIISQDVDALLRATVAQHIQQQKVLDSLQQAPNTSGMEVPVTMGARQTGAVNAQGQPQGGGNGGGQEAGAQAVGGGGEGNAGGAGGNAGMEGV
jgi:hypothetical protein